MKYVALLEYCSYLIQTTY